jgi:purine-cytosine permease-like protein
MIMVCASLAELFIQYKIINFAFKSLFRSSCSGLQSIAQRRGKSVPFLEKHAAKHRNADVVEDPAKPEDQVKDWMWIVGLIVTIIIAMIICQLQWVNPTSLRA